MKKYSTILAMCLLLGMLSCAKVSFWDKPNNVRIVAHTESVASSSLIWSEEDRIMAYDDKGGKVEFLIEEAGDAVATFYTYNWSGNTPVFAAYPSPGELPVGVNSPVVYLGSEQVTTMTEYCPVFAAVGKLSGKNNVYKALPMKNVMGVVKVTIDEDKVTSLKIEANGEEFVSGSVRVDYDKMINGDADFFEVVEGNQSVLLTPKVGSDAASDDGCFKKGDYYISVLPQTYSNGFTITTAYLEGEPVERNLDAPITVVRNSVFDVDDLLPDDITISLQFLNENNINPLGTFTKWADQNSAGNTYSYPYHYECNGKRMVEDMEFTIFCGVEGTLNKYSYEAKVSGLSKLLYVSAVTGKGGSWCIKLPAVKGRYLKEVSFTHTGTTYSRNFRLQEGFPTPGHYFTGSATPESTTSLATAKVTIPTGATNTAQINETKVGRAYYVQLTGKGQAYYITNITVKYTREKPVAE